MSMCGEIELLEKEITEVRLHLLKLRTKLKELKR